MTIIGAAAEGFVLLLFAALLIQYLIHRRRPAPEKNVVLFSKYFKALKLTAEEIQAATNGNLTESAFSRTLSGNIRRGADFSKIEKAVLPDGTVFAVKQWCIAKFRKRDRHKLDAEMLNFSRIRHRNLVRLMGYYMSPSSLALLMEFCPNSSLDVHLHPPGSQPCQLNWNDRLRIVMGVTTGLVYLHHETCGNAVVHCDLKAANVLLDSDMEPKLVDFGMARLIKGNSKGATAASWIGSSGYAPPGKSTPHPSSIISTPVFSHHVNMLLVGVQSMDLQATARKQETSTVTACYCWRSSRARGRRARK